MPALLEGESVGKTEIIQARPPVTADVPKKSTRAHFDVVLIRVDDGAANLYGVKGISIQFVCRDILDSDSHSCRLSRGSAEIFLQT